MRITPLYRITIGRCIDGASYDVEIAALHQHIAITPGHWLNNRAMAQGWTARQISFQVWATMRRWRKQRPYRL